MGLHLIPGQDLVGSAGARGDFAFARAVDDHLAENRLPSGDIFDDDAFYRFAFFDNIHGERVQQQVDVVFLHHLEHQESPPIRIHVGEGVPAAEIRLHDGEARGLL